MTMFSAENRRRFCGGYGGGYAYAGFSTSLGSDLLDCMAEDDDILRNVGADHEQQKHQQREDEEENESSNSKGAGGDEREREIERDEEWLQLSIGGHSHHHHLNQTTSTKINNGRSSSSSSGLVELELMPTTTTTTTQYSQIRPLPEFHPPRPPPPNLGGFPPSFFFQNHATSSNSNHEINWAFRPIPISIAPAGAAPSSSASYFPRSSSFQLYAGGEMAAPPAPAVDFRVIQPPRRPHSGVWFMLQASQNQEKHPFLPQISKSYLRIKDGRMTVRLVIKYLVNKLSLENESEIEIRCKGQRLLPFLTLQHVRDNIWSSPRDFITLLPNSSTTHHIMVLHYARTTPSN